MGSTSAVGACVKSSVCLLYTSNQRIIIVHGDGFTLVAGAVLGQHIALAQGGKAYGTAQQRHAEKSNESVFLHATSLH